MERAVFLTLPNVYCTTVLCCSHWKLPIWKNSWRVPAVWRDLPLLVVAAEVSSYVLLPESAGRKAVPVKKFNLGLKGIAFILVIHNDQVVSLSSSKKAFCPLMQLSNRKATTHILKILGLSVLMTHFHIYLYICMCVPFYIHTHTHTLFQTQLEIIFSQVAILDNSLLWFATGLL